ncbi:MAG: lysophospholipid acyltransferase family protein [Acidobacteria bacterium]|nr:lysophospholipid acyltransferase family protein [Acidobacteriota bacterium]
MDTVATSSPAKVDRPWRRFTPRERFLLWLITWTGYIAIRLLGPTIRFSVSWEPESPKSLAERPFIYSFWHNCMIPAMYWCRELQVRVMSSDSFDGEYTGRIMQKFGFVKIRGSSSKGAIRALLGMRRELERGWTVAFTIDGPKGPRYIAKPGPVTLARTTGAAMVVFHIALDRCWTLSTWDGCMIPKPFCRALMRVSRALPVPPEGDGDVFLHQLQASLDRVRIFAEQNVDKVGSPHFPYSRNNREEHS